MNCIIPLAGPDFYNEKYGIKPLYNIDDQPMIEKIVKERSWYKSGQLKDEDIIFIIRDTKEYLDFQKYLKNTFFGCKIVTLSELTKGALLSSVAGISLIKDFSEILIIDLVDIFYELDINIKDVFLDDYSTGAIFPFFVSENNNYSYGKIVSSYVVETAEKKVISNNASAGTYIFRNAGVFLKCVSECVNFNKLYDHNGNLFLCPAYNEVIRMGMNIKPVEVKNVLEYSLGFKNMSK